MVNDKYINNRRKTRPRTIGKRNDATPVYLAVPTPSDELSTPEPEKLKPARVQETVKQEYKPNPLEAGQVVKPTTVHKKFSQEEAEKKLLAHLEFHGETVEESVKPANSGVYEPLIDLSMGHNPFKDAIKKDKSNKRSIFGKNFKKRFGGGTKSIFFNIFLFLGFFVFSWAVSNAPSIISNLSYDAKSSGVLQNPKTAEAETTTTKQPKYVGGPDVMVVSSVGINAPIVFSDKTTEKGIMKDLERGVVHYGNTPLPGQAGNSVFFGHSSNFAWAPGKYKEVFALLGRVKTGQPIEVHYAGKRYLYKIKAIKVVSANDVRYLKTTSAKPTITLITCTPTGTTWKRLVVIAEQVDPSPVNTSPDTPHLPQI